MGRLDGKVAIITGGSKGLGEADARLFVAEGARVVLTDVDAENGERVARELGAAARFVAQDVRDEDSWRALVDDVMAREGALNVLVNNAGVVVPGSVETQTTEEWRFIMGVSADATFFGCKYALPAMRRSGGGSIINMASQASVQGFGELAAYCAAKGAIEALTRSVAVLCAQNKWNIRCNSIHPAGILTPMVMANAARAASADGTPAPSVFNGPSPRLGEPNDVAWAVVYLASDESKFTNGIELHIDNAMSVIPGVVE